ncbi:MAG: UDP-glucose 4-epimerase [Coriobacteriia bacterium]
MKVLVTGGAGFIGSQVVRDLAARGHAVVALDDLSSGHEDRVEGVAQLVMLDILDPALEEVVARVAPDAVVHLAAQTSVQVSIKDPERDRRINVEGTRATAEAAKKAGAGIFIFASSAAVYGDPEVLPLVETSPKSPANPYGRSKLDAEQVVAEVLEGSPVRHVSLRFSNVYGPGQDASGEGGVVAIFVSRTLGGQPVTVFGDGEQTRDFVFVEDVAGAVAVCVERFSEAAPGFAGAPVLNVSSGTETSVNEIAEAVARACGVELRAEHLPPVEGDVRRSILDPRAAAQVLRWRAETPLATGIEKTVEWFRSR